MRLKLISFYNVLIMLPSHLICSLMSTAPIAFVQWFIYSDQQKVELFLFGSSDLTNNENVEIFLMFRTL